jgi:hypothetical protein
LARNAASSANKLSFVSGVSGMLFTYIRNSVGPATDALLNTLNVRYIFTGRKLEVEFCCVGK